MSKRVKNTIPLELNLLDLPQETLRTIAKDGSTRRRLSRASKTIKDRLGSVSQDEKITDLKETMLNYDYQPQSEDLNQSNEFFSTTLRLFISDGTEEFHFRSIFDDSLLTKKDIKGNIEKQKYELRLLPINRLSNYVKATISGIFRIYYGQEQFLHKSFYKFILHINVLGSAFYIQFQWSSIKSFLENNPYYILLEGLTKKYKSLSYFYDLPTFIGNQAPTYTEEQYENSFTEHKDQLTLQQVTEENELGEEFVTKVEIVGNTCPFQCKVKMYSTDKEIVYFVKFNLLNELELFKQSLDSCKLFVKQFIQFIQITLPKGLQLLNNDTHSTIVIYFLLEDDSSTLPFYFTTNKNSIYSQNMYDAAYQLVLDWMKKFPLILKEEQFIYVIVDENLKIEIYKNITDLIINEYKETESY